MPQAPYRVRPRWALKPQSLFWLPNNFPNALNSLWNETLLNSQILGINIQNILSWCFYRQSLDYPRNWFLFGLPRNVASSGFHRQSCRVAYMILPQVASKIVTGNPWMNLSPHHPNKFGLYCPWNFCIETTLKFWPPRPPISDNGHMSPEQYCLPPLPKMFPSPVPKSSPLRDRKNIFLAASCPTVMASSNPPKNWLPQHQALISSWNLTSSGPKFWLRAAPKIWS